MAYIYCGNETDYYAVNLFRSLQTFARARDVVIPDDMVALLQIKKVELDEYDLKQLKQLYEPCKHCASMGEFGMFTFNACVSLTLWLHLYDSKVNTNVRSYVNLKDFAFDALNDSDTSTEIKLIQQAIQHTLYNCSVEDYFITTPDAQDYIQQLQNFIDHAQQMKKKYGNILFAELLGVSP